MSITEAWAVRDQQPHSYFPAVFIWDSACWLDYQKLSRYSNRLLLGITPKEKEEKSNKVFISGSQMKRMPYRCHKVLQEHNCFWALICFSAATKGGKGVNIVVNVSVHNLFCTPCDGPTWNTREKRVHKRKGDNKLTSNILSWKKAFHNRCVQLQTNTLVQLSVWVSSFLGKLGFHFPTLH